MPKLIPSPTLGDMKNGILFLLLLFIACQPQPKTEITPWVPYDESEELAANADHQSVRMRFKLIQSQVADKNVMWNNVADQIKYFSEEDYQALKPLILEQDIPTLQNHIKSGQLTYEKLTQWYLYRIVKFENNKDTYLNNMIALNPNAVEEARRKDRNKSDNGHPLYGIPVILKDNVNAEGMPTTAGAHALQGNMTSDAFITQRIKEHGGIILGKASLSEWANFMCLQCPNGYSAVGGQTLNPYGRKVFDTGGSSSGSGSSMAVNYAAAAVGTETSGSILSPSSTHSVVGLKPTIGLLSRGGIVPISSTLDTPGPMTRSVIDNAILLSAMTGEDPGDTATKDNPKNKSYWEDVTSGTIEGLRFGVLTNFLQDSLYSVAVEKIKSLGGIVVELQPERANLQGFGDLLSADMRIDLAHYLNTYAAADVSIHSIEDVVAHNKSDSVAAMPYGQGRIAGTLSVNLSEEEHSQLRERLIAAGKAYFDVHFDNHNLDAVLSINNFSAGFAAAAQYPALTVPMGYQQSGQPRSLTFIGRTFEEDKLLKMGYAYEQATKLRKTPTGYN